MMTTYYGGILNDGVFPSSVFLSFFLSSCLYSLRDTCRSHSLLVEIGMD